MEPPARFEAGTQPVAQVVAAGVAADWLMAIGMENLEAHERTITDELLALGDIEGVRILGPRSNERRIGTIAFEVEGVHPHDVGQFIDAQGIAIRVGHHCAQPVHRHFGVYASNRASSGIYNAVEDAQALLEAARDPHGKERFAPDLASENASQARDAIVQASHEYCTPGESHQFNPTCGDEATVHVEVSDNEPHTIERLVWDGHGCSISQASLSVMVDLVEGKSVDEAMHLADTFHRLMESRGKGLDDEHAEEELEDGIVFQGVSKYPMRIKCALLGWEGMKDSVAKALAAKS